MITFQGCICDLKFKCLKVPWSKEQIEFFKNMIGLEEHIIPLLSRRLDLRMETEETKLIQHLC